MKYRLILFFPIISTFHLQAQKENVTLFGFGDHDRVLLTWRFKDYHKRIEKFYIRRRVIGNGWKGEWAPVHKEGITPEVNGTVHLANTISDPDMLNSVVRKYEDKISSGRWKVKSNGELTVLLCNEAKLRLFNKGLDIDFDYALVAGFALVDAHIPTGDMYEYGLFVNDQDDPLSLWKWEYGTKSQVVQQLKGKCESKGANMHQLRWVSHVDKNHKLINGYSVKRAGKTLNELPIWPRVKTNELEVAYTDVFDAAKFPIHYELVPMTIFNTQAKPIPLVCEKPFDPEGLSINLMLNDKAFTWECDQTKRKYLIGFVIEKQIVKNFYKPISDTISQFSSSHQPQSLEEGVYRLRLLAKGYHKGVFSNDVTFKKEKEVNTVKAVNLLGEYKKLKDKRVIQLTWDATPDAKGYYLVRKKKDEPDSRWTQFTGLIDQASYDYVLYNYQAEWLDFGIIKVLESGCETPIIESVQVLAPTKKLPKVFTFDGEISEGVVSLSWQYDDIQDLKGFRLYKDGKLEVDEVLLTAETRTYKLKGVATKLHKWELVAITRFGVESIPSTTVYTEPD